MKTSLGSAALVGVTFAAVMACYAVSIRVGSERTGVERVRATIAADTRDIRMLQAELRTRARLPELQRWNEQVLALAPPRPDQFLGGPVVLASYAGPATGTAVVRFAAARPQPRPAQPVEQIAYLNLPHGVGMTTVAAPAITAATATGTASTAAAPMMPHQAAHATPTASHHPAVATASLALDATLGGQIDAAAAAEAGRKAAMR